MVRTLRLVSMDVRLDPSTPWLLFYSTKAFPEKSAQRAIVVQAVQVYRDPRLEFVGGFFYHAMPKRTQTTSTGCVDFSRPFLLLEGFTWRDVAEKGLRISVVYIPNLPP